MTTPVEALGSLRIGTVEYVSAAEIRIVLELDAPETTALNSGIPTGFPRINGYLVIPIEGGSLVGLVSSISIERSAFPKRTGLKDFGLIDLPFPLRKLVMAPLGTLVQLYPKSQNNPVYKLERGVYSFPSVGDAVLIPSLEQSLAIVERAGDDRRVQIGTAPFVNNAKVTVDPDKLFGRHVAVLGNTGSGKSCSVAGLIRWSIEAAQDNLAGDAKYANARFIILDPNGEYSETFSDLNNTRVFQVSEGADLSAEALTVPAWMWNSHEWSSFSAAAAATQKPILMQALRDLRSGNTISENSESDLARLLLSYNSHLASLRIKGPEFFADYKGILRISETLLNLTEDLKRQDCVLSSTASSALESLTKTVEAVLRKRSWSTTEKTGFNAFNDSDLREIETSIRVFIGTLPKLERSHQGNEDAPIHFDVEQLPTHLEHIATEFGTTFSQFISTLKMRVKMMLSDQRLSPILNPVDSLTLIDWLDAYLGSDKDDNRQITVIDLSFVPSDVLHLTTAVISRIIFESLQRYRRQKNKELPTVIVLEEAHNFIRKNSLEIDGANSTNNVCREIFEKIAREGRKYGLGMVLSSQRPAELSPTVLAQCNTFLLHRLVNDRDQELVARLVPDSIGGLLKELPSLPARNAVLLGWASNIPILVEMNELKKSHRPRSEDPHFWDVWTGKEIREVNWERVVKEWTS